MPFQRSGVSRLFPSWATAKPVVGSQRHILRTYIYVGRTFIYFLKKYRRPIRELYIYIYLFYRTYIDLPMFGIGSSNKWYYYRVYVRT